MKTPFVVVFVLAAILAGCKAQETLSSSGTGQDDETTVSTEGAKTDGQQASEEPGGEESSLLADIGDEKGNEVTGLTIPKDLGSAPSGLTAESLAGMYTGKLEIPQAMIDELKQKATPEEIKQLDEQIKAFEAQLKTAKITLELKNDGTYEIVYVMGAMNTKENGNWAYKVENNSVVIEKPKLTEEVIKQLKARGKTDEQIAENQKKPIIAQVSSDGKTIRYSSASDGGGYDVTFTKN